MNHNNILNIAKYVIKTTKYAKNGNLKMNNLLNQHQQSH